MLLNSTCLDWSVDPVLFHITDSLAIRWYGLCFLMVFVLGFLLLRWQMVRGGYKAILAVRFAFWGFLAVFVGSWLGHRLFYEFDKVVEHPLHLFDLTRGISGLSSHGATFGLLVALFLFGRKNRIPMGEMLDRFVFAGCASGFVRIGNFFNSEILGAEASIPWAVCFARTDTPLIPRHPVQLYEAAINLAALGVLVLVDRKFGGERRPRWIIGGSYFTFYFFFRFVAEFFKDNSSYGTHLGLSVGQWLSVPCFMGGVLMLYVALTRHRKRPSQEA